ncbi:MAG: hypothetical protein HUU02_12245 [Bacteroidetes bacterium]|nr:hypothetical protein [Bacteroidota bacterium]
MNTMHIPSESPDTPVPFFRFALRLLLAVGALLLIPLTAMQFTGEVNWDPFDFFVAFVLLTGTGLTYKLISDRLNQSSYRRGVALAAVTSLAVIWVNLAVGIIGNEEHPANLMFFGVLLTGFTGAILSGFRPHGLSLTMFGMAAGQFLIPVIAFIVWRPEITVGVVKVFLFNWVFVMLFVASGLQFRKAAAALKSE